MSTLQDWRDMVARYTRKYETGMDYEEGFDFAERMVDMLADACDRVAALDGANACPDCGRLASERGAAIDRVEGLESRLKTVKDALEWYGAIMSGAWAQLLNHAGHRMPYPILDDHGARARKALKLIDNQNDLPSGSA